MKRLKKFGFRATAFALCGAMLLGSVNAAAITPLKEDTNWQAKHNTWSPEDTAIDIPNTAGDLTNEQLQTAVLSSENTPEIVTDEVISENNHVNRLWEQEPNDNTIIFQNKDGSKTVYFYSRPVKYTDTNGEKRDKRNTLINTVENAKYAEDYGYVNAYNDIKTYYPSSIRPEKGMVLETPELTVELSPMSAIEKRYILSDERELTPLEYEAQAAVTGFAEPEDASINAAEIRETVLQAGTAIAQKGQIQEIGSRAKDTMLYKGVFGSKTSIRYSSTFEGFKEDIILNENIGINKFKFRLKTNGLSLVDTGNGNYCLVDPLTGKAKVSVGDLIVTDSKPQPESISDTKSLEEKTELSEDETFIAEVQYAHHYEAETITAEQEYILTVVVDEKYLNDPETVYPVYVDPTMTVMGSGDIEDVSLYSNINYTLGSTESQQIKVGYSSPTYGTGRALYDFPILNFNTDFIFLYGNQIKSAQLKMYTIVQGTSYDNAQTLSLYEFYSQWSEGTVKWNNTSPYNYGCLIDSKSVTSGWTSFDISYVINKFKTDSDYTMGFMDRGLMLKANSETSSVWKKFASSEYTTTSYRPYIQITYNDSPPACPQVVSGAVYHLRNYSGDYLDVQGAGTADNTRLLQYGFTGNSNQQFKITNITGGEYEIAPQHTSGKVLSVNSSNQVIIEQDCNLSRQRWYIFYRNGSYHFVNKQNNTKVMEALYSDDYVYTSNNYDYCDWELEPYYPEGIKESHLFKFNYPIGLNPLSPKYYDNLTVTHFNNGNAYAVITGRDTFGPAIIDDELKWALDDLENAYQQSIRTQMVIDVHHAHTVAGNILSDYPNVGISIGSTDYYALWATCVSLVASVQVDAIRTVANVVNFCVIAYYILYPMYQEFMATRHSSMGVGTRQVVAKEAIAAEMKSTSALDYSVRDISYTGKTIRSAETLNAEWATRGYTDPPALPGTQAYRFKTTATTRFVKVSQGASSGGQFLMKLEDFQNLSAQQLKSKYALPFTPDRAYYVDLPVNTTLNCSIANKNYGQFGGGIQYDLDGVGGFIFTLLTMLS